ncbi:unnamed protein product [Brassica oleracea var. botrytis]|uniref:Uncharacterized protein n=1 Tax=Brassica oleracea TaxID=3712 RepID=A0A3P6CP45_BRAOL|nr:unnamed protein product [Brassica oleracea]
MATKKSLSFILSMLMIFTLTSLIPTISGIGKKGICTDCGPCVGETPGKTCYEKCISLNFKLGGVCLPRQNAVNVNANSNENRYCCCLKLNS